MSRLICEQWITSKTERPKTGKEEMDLNAEQTWAIFLLLYLYRNLVFFLKNTYKAQIVSL